MSAQDILSSSLLKLKEPYELIKCTNQWFDSNYEFRRDILQKLQQITSEDISLSQSSASTKTIVDDHTRPVVAAASTEVVDLLIINSISVWI